MGEKLGFKWKYEKQSTLSIVWNERLSDLLEFKQQWGHCNVPQKYAKNPKLGRWVGYQRSQYRLLKSGRESFISDERIAQLEKLGFQWNSGNQLAPTMVW